MREPIMQHYNLIQNWIRSCFHTTQTSSCRNSIENFARTFSSHISASMLTEDLHILLNEREKEILSLDNNQNPIPNESK